MLVLRPRHRSLRSGVGGTSGGGGGGGVTASLSGKAASFSAGRLTYTHPAILAGQVLAFLNGALTKERSDALVSEDSTFQTSGFPAFDIGKVLSGSAAAFSSGALSKVRSDALTGKAITVTAGTVAYNSTSNISKLLAGQVITVSAGALSSSAVKSASLTGKAATISAGAVQIVRSDTLTGKAAAFTTGVAATGLYNVQATLDASNNVTITATSSLDLSDPAKYGVEFGDGSGGVYQFAVSEPGQVSSQSITIGAVNGVIPGHILSYRPYYNLDTLDPASSRMYGAAGEILVATPGALTGKAITSATGHFSVVRSDALFGNAATAVQVSPGTLVFSGGATANLTGQAATFSKGVFKVTRTGTVAGQAADFAPGPNVTSEFEGLLLGQG